ncbi:MAG TPA: hypothetical protein VGE83_06510 [Terracidiphilus sp.]|jgi:hypothetical protein
MALNVETIRSTDDDEALVDLLSAELQRLLPNEIQEDRDRCHQALESLPRGLRAMAGMHFFDASMTMDDLAWHFGNQNDVRDLNETLNGLRELDLPEIANYFERAWKIMEPHFDELRGPDVSSDNFYDWLEETGAQEQIDPMNDAIWDFCKKSGDLGLLASWPKYARKYPERRVVSETHT